MNFHKQLLQFQNLRYRAIGVRQRLHSDKHAVNVRARCRVLVSGPLLALGGVAC